MVILGKHEILGKELPVIVFVNVVVGKTTIVVLQAYNAPNDFNPQPNLGNF